MTGICFLFEIKIGSTHEYIKTVAKEKQKAIDNFCTLYQTTEESILNAYEFDPMYFGMKSKVLISEGIATKI